MKTFKDNTDYIISNKVLGGGDYRYHQLSEARRRNKRQKRDKRNFWWVIVLLLLFGGGLVYLEYCVKV